MVERAGKSWVDGLAVEVIPSEGLHSAMSSGKKLRGAVIPLLALATLVGFTGCPGVATGPAKVTVSYSNQPLAIGWSEQFQAESTYKGDTAFIWTSDNESVATVSPNGTVTGQHTGKAMIMAKGSSSGAADSKWVTVIPAPASRKLWDGELSFTGEYGVLNQTTPYRGSGCFEGIPDPYHSPVIRLNGLPSWRADISGYDEVWFFAKCDQLGRSLSFRVSGWPYDSNTVNVDPYIAGGALDTAYRLVRIPLAALKTPDFPLDRIETLYFGAAQGGEGHRIFIDEIWAIDTDDVNPDSSPLPGELPDVRFGEIAVGGSATVTVPVTNVGSTTLEVTGVSLAGADHEEFSVVTTPFSVAPGATHNLPITFAPVDAGAKRATCTLEHNNTPLGALSTVGLSGTGVAPTLDVSDLSLDFGGVPLGNTATHRVTVRNVGNAELAIGQITSSLGAFGVSPSTMTLGPNESDTLVVTFGPAVTGDFEGTVSLASNDPIRPNAAIVLAGRGLAAGSLGELPVEVDAKTSSTASVSWGTFSGLDELWVFVGSEPPASPGSELPVQKRVATLSGNATTYTLTALAPSVDTFIRVQGMRGGTPVTVDTVHVRTPGGPNAELDSPVREVHLYAPNVLLVVMANLRVESFSQQSDFLDNGVNELVGYTGELWQQGPWSVLRADNTPLNVVHVYRHSVPVAQPYYGTYGGPEGTGDNLLDVDHRIFLELDQAVGNRDVLTIQGPSGLAFTLAYSDRYLETPVIQVNQVGYCPRATQRWAYVSGWMGDGGPLDLSAFPSSVEVVREPNSSPLEPRQVVTSTGLAAHVAFDSDSGSEVRKIDLSGVPAADGVFYRVRIPGVGVSWPTQVSEIAVFKAFYVIARGLYFNRWGRELEPDSTELGPRPPDHPTVFTAEDEWDGFGDFFPSDTPRTGERPLVGGHHNAGDFDIALSDYVVAMLLLRAYEVDPSRFFDGQLTVPQSGNGIPDILDEALWSLAAWEDLQEADGGVRAGVESYGHPSILAFADEDTLPYWTYSRHAIHSANVAGMFAQASRLVQPFAPDKAAELRTRAEMAYAYATSNGVGVHSRGTMMYASGELYRLTGNVDYRNQFEATWEIEDTWGDGPGLYPYLPNLDAYIGPNAVPSIIADHVLGYLGADSISPTVSWQAAARIEANADNAVTEIDSLHAHKNGRPDSFIPNWGRGTVTGEYTMRILALMQLNGWTPEELPQEYFDALSVSADYVLGANPLGRVWITGLGTRPPNYPLHTDSLVFAKQGFGVVPGFPVFGPTNGLSGYPYYEYGNNVIYPAFAQHPLMRRYFDIQAFVIQNEGGSQMMAQHTQMFATLIGAGLMPDPSWLPFHSEHSNPLPPRGSE